MGRYFEKRICCCLLMLQGKKKRKGLEEKEERCEKIKQEWEGHRIGEKLGRRKKKQSPWPFFSFLKENGKSFLFEGDLEKEDLARSDAQMSFEREVRPFFRPRANSLRSWVWLFLFDQLL